MATSGRRRGGAEGQRGSDRRFVMGTVEGASREGGLGWAGYGGWGDGVYVGGGRSEGLLPLFDTNLRVICSNILLITLICFS